MLLKSTIFKHQCIKMLVIKNNVHNRNCIGIFCKLHLPKPAGLALLILINISDDHY